MRNAFFCILFSFVSTTAALAQSAEVSGKVVDSAGHPLSGITVAEKGVRNAVSTKEDGSFSIPVRQNASLIFSGVGFETRQVPVKNQSLINVSLSQDVRGLSEVVITGVGVATSRKKVAIDVASVASKDFAKSATASIEQGIMGQIAGAQIQQTSGQPNSGFNIILRGINALGGTYPMILQDGVEVQDLSNIDPTTVDRIEVVKGAAAGMLYGAQGANGVIQVFTKKGIKGRPSVNVSSKFSVDNVLRGKEVVASKHHYLTDQDGYIIDNNSDRIAPDETGQWPTPAFDGSIDAKNDKPYKEKTYDHIKQSYQPAFSQVYNVSISGGGEKSDYALTASYLDQHDVYSNSFRRMNVSLNLGVELFKGFTIRSNTQMILSEDNDLTDPNSRFKLVNSYAFIDFKYRDSLGNLVIWPVGNDNQHNPLSEADWHKNSVKPLELIQNVNINYKFPRFVTLDYKLGLEKTITDGFDYYLNQTQTLQGNGLPWGNVPAGSITKYNDKITFINSLASVFVNTDFQKDFHLNIPLKTTTQLAYDYRKDEHTFYGTTGTGLPTYPPVNINSASSTFGSDNPASFFAPPVFIPGTFVTYGILVNQSFDYGNLFGISGGLRSDYSSEFGEGSKPFTFYRGTAYFRPSELLQSGVLSDWKIRGAYGEAGIQPNRYQRQVTFNVNALGTGGVGLSLPLIAENPNLQVQVSKELELGTDITLLPSGSSWFSKIFFSGTYWKRKSSNIIQNADVAFSTGFQSRTDNLSTIGSKGVDLTVDATVYSDHFLVWNFGYRMGFAKSHVDKIYNGKDIIAGVYALKQGQDVGQLYGQYVIRNINQLKPDGSPYIADADKKYYVIAGGLVVDTRTNKTLVSDANDQKSFGSVYPDFTAAFLNTFTIKQNLTLSFQFDWYHGNKIYNVSRQWLYRDQIAKDFDNPVTIGTKTGAFVNYYTPLYNGIATDDWFVEDGSFIRLRNLSLSYDFSPMLKTKWIKRMELTLAGRNLWTASKYKGLDPENTSSVDTQGNDVSTQVGGFKGVDYFGVPNTRSYQVGLSLGF